MVAKQKCNLLENIHNWTVGYCTGYFSEKVSRLPIDLQKLYLKQFAFQGFHYIAKLLSITLCPALYPPVRGFLFKN